MSRPQDVQKLVQDVHDRLQQRRVSVVVVGDMILDTAIEGVPGGRHPETRVPILREATANESIGGAANIALTLARLGAGVALFGIIGSDLPGRQLENLLDRQSFEDYLITERGWPTPRKDWIYEREGDKVTLTRRIDYDRPLSGSAREELVGEFRARCPAKVDVVILADHGLGSIGPESLALIGLARERGASLVAIPRTPILRGQALDAIVINSPEMQQLARSDERSAATGRALCPGICSRRIPARAGGGHLRLSRRQPLRRHVGRGLPAGQRRLDGHAGHGHGDPLPGGRPRPGPGRAPPGWRPRSATWWRHSAATGA